MQSIIESEENYWFVMIWIGSHFNHICILSHGIIKKYEYDTKAAVLNNILLKGCRAD